MDFDKVIYEAGIGLEEVAAMGLTNYTATCCSTAKT
jgi:hypothetical protein